MTRPPSTVTPFVNPKTDTPTGWRCPSCGAGNAPTTPHCSCAGPRALVSPETFSARWDMKIETVRAWCRSGRLPAVRIGAMWRIDVAAADRSLKGSE